MKRLIKAYVEVGETLCSECGEIAEICQKCDCEFEQDEQIYCDGDNHHYCWNCKGESGK